MYVRRSIFRSFLCFLNSVVGCCESLSAHSVIMLAERR
nr:MAG TPA: hypothetical protein [Caudoviricetes sp.]DAP22844.1 MAG TPA: hypothetical protein [Caudoviricetes sp.]